MFWASFLCTFKSLFYSLPSPVLTYKDGINRFSFPLACRRVLWKRIKGGSHVDNRKSDISRFVLLAPSLHGYFMLVGYLHHKSELHSPSTQPSLSSCFGYSPFLFPSCLRMILASNVTSLLAQEWNSSFFFTYFPWMFKYTLY